MENNLITTENNSSWDAIKEAHGLSYDPEKLETYYDKWSSQYDNDVSSEEYSGPRYIAEYLTRILETKFQVGANREELKILDAGCGTGLVGVEVEKLGFGKIDGFDLSNNMVEVANNTGSYGSLTGGCNMNAKIEAYQDNQYEIIVCCGVFTLGHVHSTALEELIRITKPGGLIIISTRKSYYDGSDFQEASDRLQAAGKIKLIDHVMDGPYIAEEGAHYWAFVVA
ncbi:MAG: class I SAM-dependent methyltransferase [Sphaerospermopsis sp. SIO1G2]|nr:class I SAM-dependent methyltransferase [Sphaerospermopsis sp. SIO1G1]NET73941.1 class I SAM-dependent methyltransferase [Sphaerospermopsis sp. SIO1G2]